VVDPATGNLTNVPGSPFTSSLFGQVEPSQGKFLLVLGPKPNTVGSYAIDPTTGALSQGSATTAPLPEPAPVKMVIVEPAP
jgi:6-phosphogluconolactonase (cycloisomerase 2 family)